MNYDEEKGYVIRCHDLFDGKTWFKGCKNVYQQTKAGYQCGEFQGPGWKGYVGRGSYYAKRIR